MISTMKVGSTPNRKVDKIQDQRRHLPSQTGYEHAQRTCFVVDDSTSGCGKSLESFVTQMYDELHKVYKMVFTIAFVAVADGSSVLLGAVHLLFDDACKAMVKLDLSICSEFKLTGLPASTV